MDRRLIKPKRRQHQPSTGCQENDRFTTSTPCGSGVKRKFEDWQETPIKRSRRANDVESPRKSNKYSANDRLNKYRKLLDEKKHQVVKVHRVLEDNTMKRSSHQLSIEDASVITDTLLLDSSEKIKEPQKFLETIDFNKSRHVDYHSKYDEVEDMDWSPVDEEELAADIQKLRSKIKPQPSPVYLNLKSEAPTLSKSLLSDDPLYIIVDTNIFISHLRLLRDIVKMNRKSNLKPTVYVPWMVLQELDYFKDGRAGNSTMQTAAKRAISFINDMLTRKDRALKGQTVHEALTHDFSNPNADDNILFCCLTLQQKQPKIVLLSNDQNLRSKAIVHSIEATSTKTIMDILNDSTEVQMIPNEATPIEKVANIFTNSCTEIIKGELEKAYGNTTYKMVTKPPWSLEQCLKYLKRFWIPVFSLVVTQKQCLKAVDDLLHFLKTNKGAFIESSDTATEEFVKLTLSLCVYFKNCFVYETLMKTCIGDIQRTVK